MLIKFNLNGRDLEVDAPSGELLLETLRRLGCWSVKHGCETGECGSCSILLDETAVSAAYSPMLVIIAYFSLVFRQTLSTTT